MNIISSNIALVFWQVILERQNIQWTIDKILCRPLKTESCDDANFIVMGDNLDYHNDNLQAITKLA